MQISGRHYGLVYMQNYVLPYGASLHLNLPLTYPRFQSTYCVNKREKH